jgi:hypothetical protein
VDDVPVRLRGRSVLGLTWWQALMVVYIAICGALIVWYFRAIHRQYQTDRKFHRIIQSEDWDA